MSKRISTERQIERCKLIVEILNNNNKKHFTYKNLMQKIVDKGHETTLPTLKKDIFYIEAVYKVNLLVEDSKVMKICLNGKKLYETKLIKSKDMNKSSSASLIIEVINGFLFNSKSASFPFYEEIKKKYHKPKGYIEFDSSSDQIEIIDDYFNKIISAIDENCQIKIFLKNDKEHLCAPVMIKVFNKRWYLIGFKKVEDSPIKLVRCPFNDIKKIELTKEKSFESLKEMLVITKAYFKNRIGVSDEPIGIKGQNETIGKLVLKIKKDYFDKYYHSKPLFAFTIIQVDKKNNFVEILSEDVYINKELVTALFSYKSYVEVLEPKFLRNHMIEVIKDLNIMYDVKITTDNSTYS